ncbi:hypothetical protein ACG04Q_19295 [Roseateles sp. DXS20W]|uniref:Uncharacterized protein n=1 Tax=Pelomonas lactea TaxID=3299030 RepID=A0ABW7GP62_9BURK
MTRPTEKMLRVPSYLKGLVETRARADASVCRLQALIDEAQQNLERAKAERDAADVLIQTYNPNLDPTTIVPVRAWRGRYGKRGEKAAVIRAFVQAAYPQAVSTVEVFWHVAMTFQLDFPSAGAREEFKKSAIRNPLREMAKRGEVERLDLFELNGQASSTWRWAADLPAAGASAPR